MSDEPTTSGQSAPVAKEEVEKKVEETATTTEASSEAPATDDAKSADPEASTKDNTEGANKDTAEEAAKETESSKADAETKDSEPSDKTDKSNKDDGDIEMKDATDAQDTKEASESAAAEPEAAPAAGAEASASTDATADKSKARRRSSGVAEHKGKKLNKKASKAKLFHTDAKPGDHFLVKLKGYPQWPVIICDEEMLPETLIKSRPVTAKRADGTYRDDYADGGKRANDRTFPVMYLRTNEFGWVPNSALQELTSEKASEMLTDKIKKVELRDAFELAIEQNPLDHYKEELHKYQEDLAKKQAAKEAKEAAKKNKKKTPAIIDDDLEMPDADEEAPTPKEKGKSKKRKAEEEVVTTPARTESAKKPKIKLNTSSTPKATNGTSTPKTKESTSKPKSKSKNGDKKEKEVPKEPELTAEEKRQRKEKEVLFLRHKLQKGLLTRDQEPKEDEMKMMSDYITKLESFPDLEGSIIRATKINKVLKAILKLESIPKEEEFHFKSRSSTLLDKWNKILASGDNAGPSTPAPTNGVNGTSGKNAAESKDSKEAKETPAAANGAKGDKEGEKVAGEKEKKSDEKTDEEKPEEEKTGDKIDAEKKSKEPAAEKAEKPVEKASGEAAEESAPTPSEPTTFGPLFDGGELAECVQLREKLFETSWARIETKKILRDANSATLDQVTAFIRDQDSSQSKIPTAFVITGPNIASQDLLFEQLSETLQESTRSKFVRLKSSEASNIKAALKKIVEDATSSGSLDDEDAEVAFGDDGRKYLNYDLEGLYAFSKTQKCHHMFVAFQDSEGFDSGLLSDLITLFNSWRPKIPFTLLFGVATSVELLQARLLKSACQHLYGAQFDVVQTGTILEQIFKPAVAASDVTLFVGPNLVRSIVERQQDQVASIQSFVASIKYAYMCHFYANPLSLFGSADDEMNSELVQDAHLEALRSLPSFRREVEKAVDAGELRLARSLLEDDDLLQERLFDIPDRKREWATRLLRSLKLVQALGVIQEDYSQVYMKAVAEGIDLSPKGWDIVESIKRMQADDFVSMLQRVQTAMADGDDQLCLAAWESEAGNLPALVDYSLAESKELLSRAQKGGNTLRSAYSGHSKVLRTTVVAQKVQLSHDSAALSDGDKAFTVVVERFADLLQDVICCEPAADVFLHETWLYDSKTPYRDVFVPRPQDVFERSLRRPQDYLACSCCSTDEGISTSLPATSLLYHLYLETGNLINVADLWSAFYAMVGGGDDAVQGSDGNADERAALVLFYRGLAELKALGFVKMSRRKTDHIAKLKWL
ncbi:Origin recognition complex subunit 3 [Colletotrichum orbiculare MAFF 240422]|uniref:Origin recognition complex subunit 3 n=1 Tax=Colletotrichum orbiculare (strain 104-T / ATCC 96160 / CBS 514.97 / LARS 414 / MAFF 240422) TaxID=1213857 RepID=A0A484G9Q4_COLOR|nr:Origin recognition complex subunit 3 [Colletotrichum orbiculare MAFF 240422]